ncbi:MFS transporter [Reyranella sp.]|uniref:MFS transporter n=1 Tax=Reyranella sp. TaxID=1929291 RepID=UPI0026134A07|nr:MFS transporter [Reyranella sp.]HQS16883.1 MFS transporter [Reyranella sp.]HQT12632.1 MFS transporter [Reyranella sp.]
MKTFRRTPALALSFAGFLTQLDVTAVIVALPTIGDDLGFGLAAYAWTMDAYSLAFTATLLASGALADRHGRRRALLVGNVLFAVASLACGLAWDGPSLWAARAAQGFAAAFVITGSIALTASAYPDPADRARAFGLAGIVSGAAMAVGPTLGGIVAASLGWRWIFLANLPFCLLAAWIVPRLVAEERATVSRPLDLAGVALLTLGLGIAIETLLAGRTVVHLAVGTGASLLFATSFVVQQRRRPQPILDPALLTQPALIAVALLLITVSIGYWAVLVYLPLFLTAAFGLSTAQAGIALLAATLPMVVLPPLAGHLATRWGWRTLFTAGLAVIAIGDLALALEPTWTMALLGMAIIATGAALVQSQLSGAVVTLAPPAQAGMASALTIVMRQGGFAIGIALLGAALGQEQSASGYALAFGGAAASTIGGAAAAFILLPARHRT